MVTLSKTKFSENSSYILAALLTMTEDDLARSEANAYMGMIDTEELTPEDMAEDGKNGLSPNGKPRYTVYPWDLEE